MADHRPPSDELIAEIRKFTDKKRGKLYMPIPLPQFADWPSTKTTKRLDLIRPHLDHKGGTALDIGTHFGTFAHFLEDEGYRVTAVEHSRSFAWITRELRDMAGKSFEVIHGSVFDMARPVFDVTLALNIFHHFLKDQPRFDALVEFLGRLETKTMFFEAHDSDEAQMDEAYRNMDQETFVGFVAEHARLPVITPIGQEKRRTLYKLTRD